MSTALPRVLYISANGKLGGAEALTRTLMQGHIENQLFDPSILFFRPGPLVQQMVAEGFKVYVLDRPPRLRDPLSCGRAVAQIRQLLQSGQIDLVHSVMGYAHLFGGPAAHSMSIPKVWFQHGPTGYLDWLVSRINSDYIITNSEYTASCARGYFPSSGGIKVVYPGVETIQPDHYRTQAETLRLSWGLNPEQTVYGLVARICPMKGQLLFVEAFAEVLRKNPKARALIIGEPFLAKDKIYHRLVLEKVKELRLERAVRFTGFISPPQYGAILACDVIVNASIIPEPFGLSVVEAMMLERSIVAPDIGGPAEILLDGKTGWLFRAGDRSALAERLMAADRTRGLTGASARMDALKRFSAQRMTQDIEALYTSLVQSRSKAA